MIFHVEKNAFILLKNYQNNITRSPLIINNGNTMTKILSVTLMLVSLNIFSLNPVQDTAETTLVTAAFLQELSEHINKNKNEAPERKKALKKLLEDLKKTVTFYDADLNKESYLRANQTFRFIKGSDHNYPFQALYLSKQYTWNQSRNHGSITFSELALSFSKYSTRYKKKNNKNSTNPYKKCKIWIFTLTGTEVSEYYVYCERGLATQSVDLTFGDQSFIEQPETEMPPIQAIQGLSPDELNLLSDMVDLLPRLDFGNIEEPGVSVEELLSGIHWEDSLEESLVESNATVIPAQDKHTLDQRTSILSHSLGYLLQVYGPEQTIAYINQFEKENTVHNPIQLPNTLRPKSSISKSRSRRK